MPYWATICSIDDPLPLSIFSNLIVICIFDLCKNGTRSHRQRVEKSRLPSAVVAYDNSEAVIQFDVKALEPVVVPK